MKILKKLLLAVFAFGALLLAGCGRSDMILTVNEDGSFKAVVNYGIVKEGVASDEVLSQVKSFLTDALDQSGIPYTETEDETQITVTVERDFANLDALTSDDAWQGIGFVPRFRSYDGDGVWARYEDGRLKLSGDLDTDAFGASEIATPDGGFGGSITVILPSEAENFSGGEKTDAGYVWSGKAGDTVRLDLTSGADFSDLPQAQVNDSEGGEAGAPEKAGTQKEETPPAKAKAGKFAAWPAAIAAAVIIAAAVVVIACKRRGGKKEKPDEEKPDDGTNNEQ